MYEPDGSVFQISKTYIDQNGNTVYDLYYPSESGEGFYHAYHDVYDQNNNPVEGYELDEFGTLWMTYSRSEREGGGFYVDYYYLNEDTGELEYFYSDEYDENGDIIWNDKDWL